MREQMQARLKVLKSELEAGEVKLAKVEKQRTYLRETLLQIGGATQVLEELLAEGRPVRQDGAADPSKTQVATASTNGGDG